MRSQFNYFYCNTAISKKQFESAVKVPYKRNSKKNGIFSYGYYKAVFND